MRIRRAIGWGLGSILLSGLVVAGVLYLMLSAAPSAYRPVRLGQDEQDAATAEFWNQVLEWISSAGAGKPFTWTITAAQVNRYLASVDRIASSVPSRQQVRPLAEVERAGLVAPAVAMEGGKLTVMVRSKKYDKIVSADIVFAFDARGRLSASVRAVRVGLLPVPKRLLVGRFARVAADLAERLDAARRVEPSRAGRVSLAHVAGVLRELLAMLGGRRVLPVVTEPLQGHRAQVRRIEIRDGRLTVHADPLPHPRRGGSSARPRVGGARSAPAPGALPTGPARRTRPGG